MIADNPEPPELDRSGPLSPAGYRPAALPFASSLFLGPEGLRAGWSLLIFILVLSILLVPTVPLFQHHALQAAQSHAQSGSPDRTLANIVTEDGSLFLVLLLSSIAMSHIESRPFAAYGLGATPGALRQLLAGLLWGLLFLSLLVLILWSSHLLVFDRRLLRGPAIPRYAAEWAFGFLCVGLFEEYLLRGFVLFTLARGLAGTYAVLLPKPLSNALGFWTAATLLASVFGLSHHSNPGESSIGLLSAGAVALVFSLSLWRTGSLWWAVGFHAAWDWAQSFLFGVADSGAVMEHRLLASHPLGRPILSGGLTGPEGSIYVFPVLVLVALVLSKTLPRRPASAPLPPPGPALSPTFHVL